MHLSIGQLLADRKTMEQYICERIPGDGTRVILATGEEGDAWADLFPVWNDGVGWELHMERSDGWVSLQEVYDHFRRQEMTWREWYQCLAWSIRSLDESQRGRRANVEASAPDSILVEIRTRLDHILDNTNKLLWQQGETSRGSTLSTGESALTKKEVARRFQISTRTVDRWRSMGVDLGEINVNGTPRFSPEKIANIIATQKVSRRRRTS
jgi:hypothetical protein